MDKSIRPQNERKWPKIYVRTDVRPKTVKDLIILLFRLRPQNAFTPLNSVIYKGSKTFSDKACRNVQCYEDRYRSFDDIYACCRTYFPNVTPKKVMHELLMVEFPDCPVGRTVYIKLSVCGGMQRIRVWYTHNPLMEAIPETKYNSMWNWFELLSMLGISPNMESINAYITKHKTNKKD